MKAGKIIGTVFVFVGVVLVLNSGIFFTGLVVAGEDSGLGNIVRVGSLIGTLFIVVGGIFTFVSKNIKKNKGNKSY